MSTDQREFDGIYQLMTMDYKQQHAGFLVPIESAHKRMHDKKLRKMWLKCVL